MHLISKLEINQPTTTDLLSFFLPSGVVEINQPYGDLSTFFFLPSGVVEINQPYDDLSTFFFSSRRFLSVIVASLSSSLCTILMFLSCLVFT